MKIDFRKIEVPVSFDGKTQMFDVAETLGNYMMYNGSIIMDIGFEELAKKVYFEGEVDVPEKYANAIKQVVMQTPFIATVKRGICNLLDAKE